MSSASASSQVVWNDCRGHPRIVRQRVQRRGRRRLLQPVAPQPRPTLGRAAPAPNRVRPAPRPAAGRCPTSPIRATRPPGPWSPTGDGAAGPASAAPASPRPTNAGLFADTNQGCLRQARPGRTRPLRSRATAPTSPTSRRGTTTSPAPTAAHFAAGDRLRPGERAGHTGRPEPVPRPAGRGRVPLGGVGQPQHGPDQRERRHHDLRGRVRQRDVGLVRIGRRPARSSRSRPTPSR